MGHSLKSFVWLEVCYAGLTVCSLCYLFLCLYVCIFQHLTFIFFCLFAFNCIELWKVLNNIIIITIIIIIIIVVVAVKYSQLCRLCPDSFYTLSESPAALCHVIVSSSIMCSGSVSGVVKLVSSLCPPHRQFMTP